MRDGARLQIAWWDNAAGCGEAAVIVSDEEFGDEVPPFTLFPVRNLCSPSPAEGRYFDYDFDFDPARDAAHLASLQRRERDEDGLTKVGGTFEAFHVHARGIDRFEIVEWPDRVGQRIHVD